MTYEERGTWLSFNQAGEVCGGGFDLASCDTVKELVRRSTSVDTNVDVEWEFPMGDGWWGNNRTNTVCGNCDKSCGVAVHVVNNRPTEELCFTFTDESSQDPIDYSTETVEREDG